MRFVLHFAYGGSRSPPRSESSTMRLDSAQDQPLGPIRPRMNGSLARQAAEAPRQTAAVLITFLLLAAFLLLVGRGWLLKGRSRTPVLIAGRAERVCIRLSPYLAR